MQLRLQLRLRRRPPLGWLVCLPAVATPTLSVLAAERTTETWQDMASLHYNGAGDFKQPTSEQPVRAARAPAVCHIR